MDSYLLIIVIFTGLVFGSFLSVIVSRLDQKSGILTGRSECPNCLAKLKWQDLIPIFSFLALRGKCRYCGEKISWLYLTIEITSATTFFLYFWVNGLNLGLTEVYYLTLIILLVALIFFDILYLILPDKIVFSLAGIAIFYDIFFRWSELINLLASGFSFAFAFAIIYLASRGRAMGFGDVKLALVMGLILGYPTGFFAVILAIWSAALWGVVLMLSKKATMKTALPFGSFLSATTIMFIIFGKTIYEKISFYQYFF